MKLCIMTTDTIPIAGIAAYTTAAATAPRESIIGAWTTKFGPLNRAIFLQESDSVTLSRGLSQSISIPQGVQITTREQQVLEEKHAFRRHNPDIAVYELRTYDLYIGAAPGFLELMLNIMPAREKYSPNFGIWRSLSGRLDQVLHLWGYRSIEERDRIRSLLDSDSDWQAYVPKILPMIQHMQSVILQPLPIER